MGNLLILFGTILILLGLVLTVFPKLGLRFFRLAKRLDCGNLKVPGI